MTARKSSSSDRGNVLGENGGPYTPAKIELLENTIVSPLDDVRIYAEN